MTALAAGATAAPERPGTPGRPGTPEGPEAPGTPAAAGAWDRAATARYFWWLTVTAVVVTYLLIVAGAVVRVTGSGLGCPDWPTCHGHLIPPLEPAAMIEYTHRLLGALASALIVAVPVCAWRWQRQRRILIPATLIPALLAVQVLLGAVVVWLELPPMVVLVHLGFALLILGGLVWVAAQAGPQPRVAGDLPAGGGHYRLLVAATAAVVLLLALSGAFTRATGASWACAGFPGCAVPQAAVQALQEAQGAPVRLVHIHLFHRGMAYFATVLVAASVAETWRLRRGAPALKQAAALLAGTLVVQVAIGAAAVSVGLPAALRGAHVAGAAAVWATSVLLVALAWRTQGTQDTTVPAERHGNDEGRRTKDGTRTTHAAGPRSSAAGSTGFTLREKARAYLGLTKPKVILLLEAPTLAAMLVAGPDWPSPLLVAATLLGGALAAGGAAAINCYLDRDIDAVMGERTRQRAIPAGIVSPGQALAFGLGLGVASFVVLALSANLLAAALAQVALLFYVFVYTRWLKRSTPSNIVIGGAAGAIPPLVGWAAVTGEVGPAAWLLFAIIFFWTPPHFWALALNIRRQYERANIPMLPVVRGEAETRRQIILYTLQMISVTVLLFAFQFSGLFYLGAALALGAIFLYLAGRLWWEATARAAMRLFHYSMLYLWLLCAALVLDKRVFW